MSPSPKHPRRNRRRCVPSPPNGGRGPPIRCRRCASRPCSDFSSSACRRLRDETWRYTNLRSLAAQSFVDAPRKTRGEIEPHASLSLLGKTDRAASLLMVNGYPIMPFADGLINGIEINSIRDII